MSVYKSNGYKPTTTGKYKTRKQLISAVIKYLNQKPDPKNHKGCYQKMTQVEIAERCGISPSLVSNIKAEILGVGRIH